MSLNKIKKGINNNFKNELIPIPELPQNLREEFLKFFTSEEFFKSDDPERAVNRLVLNNLKFTLTFTITYVI